MTTTEKIAVMQAFADGKKIEAKLIGCEKWEDVEDPVWNWFQHEYRIRQDMPRTWEEFCKQYSEAISEYFVTGDYSEILHIEHLTVRNAKYDANLLETKEDAEGLLALIKLKRLRDAWWGDWRPDLKSERYIYCVCKHIDELEVANTFHYRHFLVFETKEIAEDFLGCFKDLINKAEMWL